MTAAEVRLASLLNGELTGGDGTTPPGEPLVAAAEAHGITALLWDRLNRPDAADAGQEIRQMLAPHVRAAATRDVVVQRELAAVLDALAADGVRVVVMKGAALAYTVYPASWQRPRTDTDLLIAAADAERAVAVLERRGYRRSPSLSSGAFVSHQLAFERADRHGVQHVVDLHWKVVNPQLLADVLPFELLWSTARPAPALGRTARVPSLEASVVVACVHRLAHHQDRERLIWLYDLKLLAGALGSRDWEALIVLAVSRGVAALCLDGLRQASRRVHALVPPHVEASLASAATGEPSAFYAERIVHKRDVLVSDLALLPTWRARVRLLREHAFPPVAFVMARYESRHRLLLPAFYAHRLVTGAWKWLRA